MTHGNDITIKSYRYERFRISIFHSSNNDVINCSTSTRGEASAADTRRIFPLHCPIENNAHAIYADVGTALD